MFTSLIPPTVASAHHAVLNGSASCQSNGTYVINWSIKNWSDVNGPMTITGINRSIGVSVGTQVNVDGVTGLETLPNQSATITLTVNGSWVNGNTKTNDKSVTLNGDCYPPSTNTPVNTATNTPVTATNTATNTPTNTATSTPETPRDTPTNTPTATPTNTPTDTPTPTITNTPENTSTGTVTPTDTPTNTPTDAPTNTPTQTPTITPTIEDPFNLIFYCMGFTVVSLNNFESTYEWSISGGPSGTGIVPAFGSVSYNTDYYPGIVTLYSGGLLMAAGYLPEDCDESRPSPTPTTPPTTRTPSSNPTEVVKTLIPPVSSTPDILIPVTGVDLGTGNSLQQTLFNLGLLFLGLGLVMRGFSRKRSELKI